MNDAKKKEQTFQAYFLYRKFQVADAADLILRFLWDNGKSCGMDPVRVNSLYDLLEDLKGRILKGDG